MINSILEFTGRFSLVAALVAPPVLALIIAARSFIKHQVLAAFDAVTWLISRKLNRTLSVSVNMRRYCRLLSNNPDNQHMSVPGARDITLKVDDMFVNLHLESATRDLRTVTDQTILDIGNRLRIVGDPGSGKSTLAKKLLVDVCRKALQSPKRSRIPIRIELKTLRLPENEQSTPAPGKWLLEHLKTAVQQVEGYNMGDLFDYCSKSSGLLVLLDGLDEIATSEYANMSRAINELSQLLANLSESNVLLLTMRVQFHQQVARDFEASLPMVLQLKRFSTADIYEFLTNWFAGEEKGGSAANRVFVELSDRPSLRDLCTNPLILSMYVVNFQHTRSVELPDTRTVFYSDVVYELLVMRRARQLDSRAARIAKRNQREAVLGRVALHNMLDLEQATNQLDWTRAVVAVQDELSLPDGKTADDTFTQLSHESGLITIERDAETFRFIHLTFCEYFAALEAVQGRDDGWELLIERHREIIREDSKHGQARLLEVIPFAAALSRRSQRKQALSDVAELVDLELLGRCILETQAYDHQAWQVYAETEYRYLTATPEDNWDQRWLQRLHLYQTVISDAKETLQATGGTFAPAGELELFFAELVGASKARLLKLFGSYAQQSAASAFRLAEACGIDLVEETPSLIVEACSDPPFLAFVLEKIQMEHDPTKALAWGRVLAEGAMRSRSVAQKLVAADYPTQWSSVIRSNDIERSGWDIHAFLDSAARTSMQWAAFKLTTASSPPEGEFPFLAKLAAAPRPSRARDFSLVLVGLGGIVLSMLLVSRLSLALSTSRPIHTVDKFGVVPVMLVSLLIYFMSFFLVGVRLQASRSLRRILNLSLINVPAGKESGVKQKLGDPDKDHPILRLTGRMFNRRLYEVDRTIYSMRRGEENLV